jgi:hypothetical protein
MQMKVLKIETKLPKKCLDKNIISYYFNQDENISNLFSDIFIYYITHYVSNISITKYYH